MKLYRNDLINMQIPIPETLTQVLREVNEKQGLC